MSRFEKKVKRRHFLCFRGKKNRYNFLFAPFVKASDTLKSSGKILQIPILSKRETFSLCKKKRDNCALILRQG